MRVYVIGTDLNGRRARVASVALPDRIVSISGQEALHYVRTRRYTDPLTDREYCPYILCTEVELEDGHTWARKQ